CQHSYGTLTWRF
nr:immunoglobulin light chain junction region [Macaca mulatta]